jgi:sulfonate transport system permease protein
VARARQRGDELMIARSLTARLPAAAAARPIAGWREIVLRLPPFLVPAILPLTVLAAWQVTAAEGWLAPQILPPPAAVLATFVDLASDGELAGNFAISLWRILSGFAMGAAAGLALGVALGLWPRLSDYLGPLLRGIAQVPSLGWLPFFMLVFGLGETLNTVLIAKACFVPIVLSTAAGIGAVDRRYLEVARVFRLPRRAFVLRLVLPAALLSIASGVRLALGQAWVSLVVVEMLADAEGIGYLMTWGRTIFQTDLVIVGMIVVGVIGFLMDAGLRRIETRLRRWTPDHG